MLSLKVITAIRYSISTVIFAMQLILMVMLVMLCDLKYLC